MAYNPTVYVNDNPPALNADNLNHAEEGIATADANATAAKTEVEGIRTGEDGTVYNSAGDAVRGQISDLRDVTDDLTDDIFTDSTRTLHYDDITWEGGYLSSSGTVTSHTAYKTSDYVEVLTGSTVSYDGLKSISSSYPIVYGYDASKNPISTSKVNGDGTVQTGTYSVPNEVKYIRFTTYNYDGDNRFNSVTIPYIANRLDLIDVEIDSLDERVDAIEDELPMYQYTLGFDDYEYTTGKLATKNGEVERTDGEVTDYISTVDMISVSADNVKMVVRGSASVVAVIGCYDSSKNLIENKTVFATGTYGQFVQVTNSVTITSDIAYIRLSRLGGIQNTGTFTVLMQRTLSEDYDVTKEEIADIEERMNPWKGKNWFVFGTSMSDDDYPNGENDGKPTGVFPKYLEAISGMKQYNHGKAGGTISLGGPYSARGQIYTEITNTDFSTADLITLEGFINDYAECIPLGELGDSTQETFYGALYLCIKYLSEHNTSATIVVITDPVGQEYTFQHGESAGITVDYSSTHKNAIGLYQVDYSNAIIKTCQWMGVHCIDVGGISQINEYHPQYIVDQCHQTELGGKQFAETIWEELKNIHCNDDVVVS